MADAEELRTSVERAKEEILKRIRLKVASAEAVWFGAIDISPKHLAIWVMVNTDAERGELVADNWAFIQEMRLILLGAGYPEEFVRFAGFQVESRETVDRDWNGSWRNRLA